MQITFYSAVRGGQTYISTTMPDGMQTYGMFDITLQLPCADFVLANMFAITNGKSEIVYRINIPVSQDYVASLPIVDNHRVASLWLVPTGNRLVYTFDQPPDVMQVLTIDPPQPIELNLLQQTTQEFVNTIARLQTIGESAAARIIFRIPV
jgi:hypothetical protein